MGAERPRRRKREALPWGKNIAVILETRSDRSVNVGWNHTRETNQDGSRAKRRKGQLADRRKKRRGRGVTP